MLSCSLPRSNEINLLPSVLTCLLLVQVNWEPYEGEQATPFMLSIMCSRDDDLYRMICPLICFYAVEYHLPHRVARQFGIRQLWPVQQISTSVELHK